ncbi:MAG: DNA-3-methyladenine glycosylase [Nitriliruptorales bacterium]|nr:DNA-3-methyladenine glycosylase [Nitriliruptorales bacterium]
MTDGPSLRHPGSLRPVDRASLFAPAPDVARRLLGCVITSELPGGRVRARLVETEAYRQDDAASHSARGRTPTTEPMFGPPGHSYVYFTYGMHHCMNVSCEAAGVGAAVLLRAAVILEGIEEARVRRGTRTDRDLARGPGRLARALGLDRAWSGCDLLDPAGSLRLEEDGWQPDRGAIRRGPRTGVRQAADVPWRFWIADVPEVSPHRRHPAAARR